jgi:hypothetical protein
MTTRTFDAHISASKILEKSGVIINIVNGEFI